MKNKLSILAVHVILSLSMFSCTGIRKAQKEERKTREAESRVLANIESVELVGGFWSKLHPCVPDSVVHVLPGRVDTLTYTTVDTVITVVPNVVTKTITRTIKSIDTIRIAVKDNRAENLLKERIEKLTADNNKSRQLAVERYELYLGAKKWKTRFWILVAAIGVLGAGYFLIRTKIL